MCVRNNINLIKLPWFATNDRISNATLVDTHWYSWNNDAQIYMGPFGKTDFISKQTQINKVMHTYSNLNDFYHSASTNYSLYVAIRTITTQESVRKLPFLQLLHCIV